MANVEAALDEVPGRRDRGCDGSVRQLRGVSSGHAGDLSALPSYQRPSLDVLGRCSRKESCESAVGGVGLATKLHLLNGPLINRKLTSTEGRLARRLAAGRSIESIVEEFYLRCLGRAPSAEERRFWNENLGRFANGIERRQALEDFVWGLLTSREFTTIH